MGEHEVPRRLTAEVWNAGPDPAQIARAADTIDAVLAHDPETKGKARAEDWRILICKALAVTFRVQADDRVGWVHAVWRW